MSFSATEACFEGFRVTRHRFGAVLLWALVWLAGLIAIGMVAMPIILPFSAELEAAQGNQAALSSQAQAALAMASYAVMPVVALLQGLLAPAVYRAVLRPQETGFGSLRLGPDEARVAAIALAITAISVALQIGGEQLGVVARQAGGFGPALLVSTGLFVLTTWVGVRLSLIAPATFAEGGFQIRRALALSRRHFWSLLGMMIISTVMATLVLLLVLLGAWPAMALIMASGATPGPLALVALLVVFIALPLGCALGSVIVWAPFAAAYRDLSAAQPAG